MQLIGQFGAGKHIDLIIRLTNEETNNGRHARINPRGAGGLQPTSIGWGRGGYPPPPVLLPNHDAEREARGGDRKLTTRGF